MLSTLAAATSPLRQSEISRAVQLPLPTVHRLVGTLVAHGFVERCSDGRHFQIPTSVPAACNVERPPVQRELDALAHQIGERTGVGLLTGRHVSYLYTATAVTAHSDDFGRQRLPAHCTALGQCLLAQQNDADVMTRLGLGPYERRTPASPTRWSELRDILARARRTGLARSHDECCIGVTGLSVPLTVQGDIWPLAIEALIPTERATPPRVRSLTRALRQAASRVATVLAYGDR